MYLRIGGSSKSANNNLVFKSQIRKSQKYGPQIAKHKLPLVGKVRKSKQINTGTSLRTAHFSSDHNHLTL
jgi:hypothetical protein